VPTDMAGNGMNLKVKNSGCVADMNRCSYHCKSGNTCWKSGTYTMNDCSPGSQNGASIGWNGAGDPQGGCQGFDNGGHIDVSFTA
jgi:hypothetical protein